MNPNDAWDRWAARSNLARIEEEGLDPAAVVEGLRARGYGRVADMVAAATVDAPTVDAPGHDTPATPG